MATGTGARAEINLNNSTLQIGGSGQLLWSSGPNSVVSLNITNGGNFSRSTSGEFNLAITYANATASINIDGANSLMNTNGAFSAGSLSMNITNGGALKATNFNMATPAGTASTLNIKDNSTMTLTDTLSLSNNINNNTVRVTLSDQAKITAAAIRFDSPNSLFAFKVNDTAFDARLILDGTGAITNLAAATGAHFLIDLSDFDFTTTTGFSTTLVQLDATTADANKAKLNAIIWQVLLPSTMTPVTETSSDGGYHYELIGEGWTARWYGYDDPTAPYWEYILTIAPVPEPATTATILTLLTLATLTLRRRNK
jgi:hypothetical protein